MYANILSLDLVSHYICKVLLHIYVFYMYTYCIVVFMSFYKASLQSWVSDVRNLLLTDICHKLSGTSGTVRKLSETKFHISNAQ